MCRFLSLRCNVPPTWKLGTRFEQTQHDAEGGLRPEAAIEASSIAVGEEEGEKQDGKATVNEQENCGRNERKLQCLQMDEDSLKSTIGHVSIIRKGKVRAILSVSKMGSFSSLSRIQYLLWPVFSLSFLAFPHKGAG